MIIEKSSPHFSRRHHKKIDMIVLHATAGSAVGAIAWVMNPKSKVSYHYLIDKKGQIYRHVADKHRAWHAGRSAWKRKRDINDYSIGLALENKNDGKDIYPDVQTRSCLSLIRTLMRKYKIDPDDVVRHADIAPGRKTDPKGFKWIEFKTHLIKEKEEGVVQPTVIIEYSFWQRIIKFLTNIINHKDKEEGSNNDGN